MFLINIRAKHQPDIRNFSEITNPVAHLRWKFPRLKPVVCEIDPRCFVANRLLVPRHIIRRNLVLSWVVLFSPNPAPIQAVIEFAGRRDRNMNVLCVQCCSTSRQQQVNCLHRTTVRRTVRLPNWQPNPLPYSKHVRYEKENYRKRSDERSATQSTGSHWRLRNSWPHNRYMSRVGSGKYWRISLRLSAR